MHAIHGDADVKVRRSAGSVTDPRGANIHYNAGDVTVSLGGEHVVIPAAAWGTHFEERDDDDDDGETGAPISDRRV